jgi:hypothetical protein
MFMNKFFSRTPYDLLAEIIDRIHVAISKDNRRLPTNERVTQLVKESPTQGEAIIPAVEEMVKTLTPHDPEMWFIKLVEEGLRKYPDFIVLGESPLVDYVGVKGESQIARGKQLQQLLHNAIESLRPTGSRPVEPLPRDWYNYVVLYDAYVEGVRNYEVMARLYISEGTFNRTRRNAVRGVAMWLIEGMQQRRNLN